MTKVNQTAQEVIDHSKKYLTHEEAWAYAQAGYTIKSGSYLISEKYYLSYGTLPDCRRSGSFTLDFIKSKDNWVLLDFWDLIYICGYYPSQYFDMKGTAYQNQFIAFYPELIRHLIYSDTTYLYPGESNPGFWIPFIERMKGANI